MRKKTALILFFVIFMAAFFRLWNIGQNLLFHYDQGRDALAIWDIWKNKDLALLGPPSDVEGIYHGALFYYFLTPIYALSGGNPVAASIFLVVLDVIGIFLLFHTARLLFKSETAGLIAALVWGISTLAVSYARWLSNVTPIPFFAILFYFLLVQILIEGKKVLWPLAVLVVGIIVQLDAAVGVFLIPLLLILGVKDRFYFVKNKAAGVFAVAAFFLPSLPLIIFDARHDLLVTKSILRMVTGAGGLGFSERAAASFLVFAKAVARLFSGEYLTLGVFILIFLLVGSFFMKKDSGVKFVLLVILVQLAGLLLYKRGTADFFFIGILPAVALLAGRLIQFSWSMSSLRSLGLLLVALFLIGNISQNIRFFSQPSQALIPIGTNSLITLEDRIRGVDFIYRQANGEPFGLWIYTIPYFKEEAWDYVFLWYGQGKYGYLPSEERQDIMFSVWEFDEDQPWRLGDWRKQADEELGEAVAGTRFHDARVEKRSL